MTIVNSDRQLSPILNKSFVDKYKKQITKFDRLKKAYCTLGLTFETFNSGSIIKIQFEDGKTKKYGNLLPKAGMHIPKLTNRVVKRRIETGDYVPKNVDANRHNNNTIMYSSTGIRNSLFVPCVAVDIIGCYWQTAFNLGVIDENTYKKGIEKDREYKDARNIAIGSLGSMTIHEKYVNGQLIIHELTRKSTACARLDIIDHVWQMAQRVATKLGPDFLMYLTDCFFVPAARKEDVCNYLAEEGYKSKTENVEFGNIERMRSGFSKENEEFFTEKVIWYVAEKDKFKFHDFSNLHNYNFK